MHPLAVLARFFGRLIAALAALFFFVLVIATLFGHHRVEAQTATEPVPLPSWWNTTEKQPAPPCAPGYFGERWPGSEFRLADRTATGWMAWAFCKTASGELYPVLRVCVHGECTPQDVTWATVGKLLALAVTQPDRGTWVVQQPEARIAYGCFLYPPLPAGAQPPAPSASMVAIMPPAGSQRATVCSEVLAAMQAHWPVRAAPPPPPPPPPPEDGWVAYGGTIFKVIDGKLATVVVGRTAEKGAQCSGITIVRAGTFVFQVLVNGFAGEATRCVKP